MELEWVDPPQEALTPVPSGLYGDMAKELRKEQNHGKWAIVPREFASEDSAKGTAQRIRTGRVAAMPKDSGFEAVSHESKVYIRYTPPEESDESGEQPAGPRLVQPRPQQARRATPENVSAQIRAWAKENGWPDLPAHGRLPQDAITAYHAAMDQKEHGES
jgi:hypothetical protein